MKTPLLNIGDNYLANILPNSAKLASVVSLCVGLIAALFLQTGYTRRCLLSVKAE